MAKRATNAATTPTPEPTKTPADLLADLERTLAMFADSARKTLAEAVEQQQQAYADIAEAIESGRDWDAAYQAVNAYRGMGSMAVVSGKLVVLNQFRVLLEIIKVEREQPADVIREFYDGVRQVSLDDTSRSRSSTDPYSNALEMHAGEGRGLIYHDVARMVAAALRKIEEA